MLNDILSTPRPCDSPARVYPSATHILVNVADDDRQLDELGRLIGELYPAHFPVSSALN